MNEYINLSFETDYSVDDQTVSIIYNGETVQTLTFETTLSEEALRLKSVEAFEDIQQQIGRIRIDDGAEQHPPKLALLPYKKPFLIILALRKVAARYDRREYDLLEYRKHLQSIQDRINALPIPSTRFDTWVLALIFGYLYSEYEKIIELATE